MSRYRQIDIFLAPVIFLFLSCKSLPAQESDAWPDTLPESVIKLKQTVRPALPEKSDLSSEFGLELLKNTLSPSPYLNSGKVEITRERFLPKILQAGRVPRIKVRLFFDRQLEPGLWAQWTKTSEKNCVFIRNQDESYLVEQFPNRNSKQRIMKLNIDYVPVAQYCHLFPIFSLTYLPHVVLERQKVRESCVKSVLEQGVAAVETYGDEYYLVHQTNVNTDRLNTDFEFHNVWWLTAHEPFLCAKVISWARYPESKEWQMTNALQTSYEEIDGIKVPQVYESFQFKEGRGDDAERISFNWKEVNKPYASEMFSEKLLEPKTTDLVFDVKKKVEGVVGVPYGAPKIKTMAPREPDSNRWLYWIFAVNLVIFVLIAVFLIVRRAAKNR